MSVSHRKKLLFGVLFCILVYVPILGQGIYVDLNSIPKAGTALIYAHQDDDLIWMQPFWKITEKFIGGAMPPTPRSRTLIHQQQDYMDSEGYGIDYRNNWITPWADITDDGYNQYYWVKNPLFDSIALDHLEAHNDMSVPMSVTEINKLKAKIEQYIASPSISRIMTHNIWGEYGHYHHMGVDIAVRELAVKYRKDVWMLGCDNGSFVNVDIPPGITYTTASYDTALFAKVRDIYKANYYWTWDDSTPSGSYNYIKIVEAGIDKSGVFTGETVTTPGPNQDVPGAYIFDGKDDYLTLAGNKNTSFTISMRVRPDEIKSMDISKMSEYPSAATCDRSFYLQSNGQLTARIFDGQSRTVTSTTALASGNWTNILMTGDGSNLKIYINGVLEGSVAAGLPAVYDSPEFILGQAQETSSFFKGQITDVTFYDHALTASEIAALFHSLSISGLTARSKEYNGTNAVTLDKSNLTLVGVETGDVVNLVSTTATGAFANKNTGSGKTVSTSGFTLSGADAYKYSLVQPSLTADIDPATITISGVTADDKVYDGTNTAILELGSATLVGVISGDDVSLVNGGESGIFDDKNVGTAKSITTAGFVLNGADAGNYALTEPIITADITAINVLISGVSAASKIYDGTPVAILNTQGAIPHGILPGDDASLFSGDATGTFVNKKVGTLKEVSISGFALTGADEANYLLTQPAAAADITKADITISGLSSSDKIYDGTTIAILNTLGATLVDVVAGDDVTLISIGANGTFASKNTGSNIQVTISGFVINGTDADNYTLKQPSLEAGISTMSVTIGGVTASNKVYDGSVNALINSESASLIGIVPGDDVSLSSTGATGTFLNKNAGEAKTVSASGFTIIGADAANYSLIQPAATADITKTVVTVTGVVASGKIYNGTSEAILNNENAALIGIVAGDAVVLNTTGATGAFADKNVGTDKQVLTSGFILGGIDAVNYTLILPTLSADITPVGLNISGVTVNDKVYDGTTYAALNTESATLEGVLSGDNISLLSSDAIGTFENKNAGSAKSVTISGFAIAGSDATNYQIMQPLLTARISAKKLTVTANNLTKSYGTLLAFSGSDFTTEGLISGDALPGIVINSPGADESADAGLYIISVAAGNNDNYEIQLVNANLEVLKVPLEVTAEDKTKEYGNTNPDLTISYSGFVLGQGPGVLDVLPVIETDAVTNSDAGTYNINVSGGADANYSFIYSNGTLTINKASQEITFEKVVPSELKIRQGYKLKANASSGLPVSFEISDPNFASVNGDILTILKDGHFVITALQEGSTNWNPAPAVPQSINVGDEFHKIPSIFTPNHDGINDCWIIPDIEQYGKLQVSIYNRYGQTIYHSDDYKNDWYGTWNSNDLPSASYYYIIKSSTKGIIKGVLNIVR